MKLQLISGYNYSREIRSLFDEYTQMLISGDASFRTYLDIQRYDDEIEHLEAKYGLPYGRLYLALCDNVPAGCIALRQLDGTSCEMKRLYVRPQFRKRNSTAPCRANHSRRQGSRLFPYVSGYPAVFAKCH